MALITTIEELKAVSIAANQGIEMATILPAINYIEETKLMQVLGRNQYLALLTAYESSIAEPPTALTATNASLIKQCRKVIAPLALQHYKTQVMAQLSEAGAIEKDTENGSPIRMWVNNLQNEALISEGMQAVDLLLTFLEMNKADYALWVSGEGYTVYKTLLMQTTDEFNQEVNINGSRLFFKAIGPDIKYAEILLSQQIGSAFYQSLVTARKGNPTTEQKKAIEMALPVIANLAIANTTLPFTFGNDNVYQLKTDQEWTGSKASKLPPDMNEMLQVKRQCERRGKQYLDMLCQYLNSTASATVLAEYFNSSNYTGEANDGGESINENLNGIFVL